MCDIKTPTKIKRKTVYKVAWLIDDKYYSCFSQHELRIGKVVTYPEKMKSRCWEVFGSLHLSLDKDSHLYNENMLGRVSGFALKSDAVAMCSEDRRSDTYIGKYVNHGYVVVVLRMVLSGSIMRGSTRDISGFVPYDHITYAGDHIDSITRIFTHKL